jgi:hypothetical protein
MGECEPIYPFYADKKNPLFFDVFTRHRFNPLLGKNWFLKAAGF